MLQLDTYRVGQKSKLLHFVSQFFTSGLCKKFATQWHAHHTYYVATLPCIIKISKNIQYLQMDGMVNF